MPKINDDKKRHLVGHATYNGDQTQIVGETKGPLTYGGMVIATEAVYNDKSKKTRVTFAHCVEGDIDAIANAKQ